MIADELEQCGQKKPSETDEQPQVKVKWDIYGAGEEDHHESSSWDAEMEIVSEIAIHFPPVFEPKIDGHHEESVDEEADRLGEGLSLEE